MRHRTILVLGTLAIAVGMLVQAPTPAQAGLSFLDASWGWQTNISLVDPDDYSVECDVVWSGQMTSLDCEGWIDGAYRACGEGSGTNHLHCETSEVTVSCNGENDKVAIDFDGDVNGPPSPSNTSFYFEYSNCESGEGGGGPV